MKLHDMNPSALEAFGEEFVSVCPPGATLSPRSKIAEGSRGKAPARLYSEGWGGYQWDHGLGLSTAQQDGANVGILGRRYPGLDLDVHGDHGEAVRVAVTFLAMQHLGMAPIRSTVSPRALLMYRLADNEAPIYKRYAWLDGKSKVELLGAGRRAGGNGQQYVIGGQHHSGNAIEWDRDLSPDSLTPVTHDKLNAFFEAFRSWADSQGYVYSEGHGGEGGERQAPTRLAAPGLADIEALLEDLPNDETVAEGRDEYVNIMVAVRGAESGHGQDAALPAFIGWAERREHGTVGEHGGPEANYLRTESHTLGWEYLIEKHARHAYGDGGTPEARARAYVWKVGIAQRQFAVVGQEPDYDAPIRLSIESEGARKEMPRLIREAARSMQDTAPGNLRFFWYLNTENKYFRTYDGELLEAAGVNAECRGDRADPAAWLRAAKLAHQVTWSPGKPQVIRDRIYTENGTESKEGAVVLNEYREPDNDGGDPTKARAWLRHVEKLIPDEGERQHFIQWCAHRVQRPGEKINHGLVLIGAPGSGKDSMLEPVMRAVGVGNTAEIAPSALTGTWTGYRRTVVLRVNEAYDRDGRSGKTLSKFALYEASKTLLAAPPATLTIEKKYRNEYKVPNVVGVVFTSNHVDGLFLDDDDRRHFVLITEITSGDYEDEPGGHTGYFERFWTWLGEVEDRNAGWRHVSAYLKSVDLSDFRAQASPPKTPAFWRVVAENAPPEAGPVADALTRLGEPEAVTLPLIEAVAGAGTFNQYKRQLRHLLQDAGYVLVTNPFRKGKNAGTWPIDGRVLAIYARQDMPLKERTRAARELVERHAKEVAEARQRAAAAGFEAVAAGPY